MTKSSKPAIDRKKLMWKKVLLLFGVFSLLIFIALIYFTSNTIIQIKKANYLKASQNADIGLVIIKPISLITFKKIADIELIKHSLEFASQLPDFSNNLITASNINTNDAYIFDLVVLRNNLGELSSQLEIISSLSKQSLISHNSLIKEELKKVDQSLEMINDLIKVINSLASKDQSVIIIFQNSDEVRATGGFMGSYALVNISQGKIAEIVIEDIYDADGQFNGFIDAPDGIRQYLSGGKGLRLPNANWHPDFPSSAEQILQFFALGDKKNLSTLIAINLDYAKTLLKITGEIKLQDYNIVIDSNNINEVLRSSRSDFFPGSKQKKHLLSQLLTQLQIKFSELDEKSLQIILQQTLNQLLANNIQFYSTDIQTDQLFSDYKFRKEMEYQENSDYLFLVESNVGINKANKNISRDVMVETNEFDSLITVNFTNNNIAPSISNLSNLIDEDLNIENENSQDTKNQNPITQNNNLGYINYQRVITSPSWNLDYIEYDNQVISEWSENIIKNSKGEEFKEIGFITTLKEKSSAVLKIKYNSYQQIKNKIFIQKQPGIPAVPYTFKNQNNQLQTLLENDFLLDL